MKKRRGKPAGMNYADVLARKRMIRQATFDALALRQVNQAMQKALWLTVVSLHDAYGFGKERLDRLFEAFQANSDQLETLRAEVDDDYAYEKLRLMAEEVSGRPICYIEDGVQE